MSHFQSWTGYPFLPDPALLMRRFKAGDRKILCMLYHHFFPALCLLAKQFTKDDVIAAQLAQESLQNLWHRRSGIENLGSIKNFLYLNTYQHCLRFIKTTQKNSKRVKTPEEEYLHRKETALNAIIKAELFSAIEEMPNAKDWLKTQIHQLSFHLPPAISKKVDKQATEWPENPPI